MSDQERQQQEYEFIMEGITTRMQMAMDKLSDNNKALRSIVKWVCAFALIMSILTVIGLLLNNRMWMDRERTATLQPSVREVIPDAEIPQLGPGQND